MLLWCVVRACAGIASLPLVSKLTHSASSEDGWRTRRMDGQESRLRKE